MPHQRSCAYILGIVFPYGQKNLCIEWLDPRSKDRHLTGMLIYKIFRADEWQALNDAGQTAGAPIDIADGFVHFSSAMQAQETAAKHFAGEDGLFLLAVDAETLGDALKWEVSRNDALFPHLYRELRLSDVVWSEPLPLQDGAHVFPEAMK